MCECRNVYGVNAADMEVGAGLHDRREGYRHYTRFFRKARDRLPLHPAVRRGEAARTASALAAAVPGRPDSKGSRTTVALRWKPGRAAQGDGAASSAIPDACVTRGRGDAARPPARTPAGPHHRRRRCGRRCRRSRRQGPLLPRQRQKQQRQQPPLMRDAPCARERRPARGAPPPAPPPPATPLPSGAPAWRGAPVGPASSCPSRVATRCTRAGEEGLGASGGGVQ